MGKIVGMTVFILFCLFSGIGFGGEKEVLILKFYTDPVSIYESADSYTNMPRKSLPDPRKSKVRVKDFDRPTSMVMFVHDGRPMWVSQSEVELNHKAVASIICTQMKNEKRRGNSDITYRTGVVRGTMGLGEGCR